MNNYYGNRDFIYEVELMRFVLTYSFLLSNFVHSQNPHYIPENYTQGRSDKNKSERETKTDEILTWTFLISEHQRTIYLESGRRSSMSAHCITKKLDIKIFSIVEVSTVASGILENV